MVAALAVTVSAFAHGAGATPTEPADPSAVAVRGQRTQVAPIALGPPAGGCLVGTVSRVASAIDPARRWQVGTVSSSWKASFRAESGSKGPVAVVGDSLTLSSMEETMRYLVDAGYGPVCIDGGVARRMEVGTGGSVSSAVEVIARIKASDPVWQMPTVRWVLAIGTNDARPNNTSTFAATIQKGRTAVGTSYHPLLWIDLRTRREEIGAGWDAIEDQWNAALVAPRTVVIRWAAEVAPSPESYIIGTPDWTHLTTGGQYLRGQLTLQALIALPMI
ncbi:MAG: hypothetical protein Q7V57_09280 [Actinomycetota bacterium]|nr:hypothetical protein [Actinomycetota bacterium]